MSFWLRIFSVFLLFVTLAFSEPKAEPIQEDESLGIAAMEQNISDTKTKITAINDGLSNSIWHKRYLDFISFGDFKKSIFGELINVEAVGRAPKVESPFGVFGALSFIKEGSAKKDIYEIRLKELEKLSEILKEKSRLTKELIYLLDQKGDSDASKESLTDYLAA